MNYPDGVYLIKGKRYVPVTKTANDARFICYARNGHRSAGVSLGRPIKELYIGHWPYMSMEESTRNYQHIYVGTVDFVNGMRLVTPDITAKELLQVLGIDYEFEE